MPREYYPPVPRRAFVRYRPPDWLPTRSAGPRAAYEDARRFIERCGRIAVRETTVSKTKSVKSRTTNVSETLHYRAQREGFLPDSVLDEWERELFLLNAREVTVAFDRWDSKAAG